MCWLVCACDLVVSRNARSLLCVLRPRVEVSEELGLGGEHRPSEPDRESLERVRDDVDVDLLGLQAGVLLLVVVEAVRHLGGSEGRDAQKATERQRMVRG